MEFSTIILSYVIWLLAVRFLASRGLGPFGSFARDLSGFMLGKALGPANDLMEDRPGTGARTWYAHGIMWFILSATLAFTGLWTAHEPYALHSLSSVGYSPSVEQATAAVHVAAAFGGLSMLLIASGFASQAKLCGGRLASESNAGLMAWAWSGVVLVGVVISHTDLVGGSNWFELPPVYYILFTVIGLPLFLNHLLTMSNSNAPPLVPQWFFVMGFAALIWTGPAAMALLAGESEMLSWMLVKVLFGGWLLSQALGVAHHAVPSAVGTPLWSRSLSSVALFGTFLTFSPLGAAVSVEGGSDFLRAFVAIFLTLSLLPIIASVANLAATAGGRMSESYGVKMTMLGVTLLIPIGVGSLFASVSAFGGGSEQAHIADTLDTLAIWGVCGAIALGGTHILFPQITGRALGSQYKASWTFWLLLVGVIGYGIGQLIVDHVDAALGSEAIVTALEDAGQSAPDTTQAVQVFASMMFYAVAIGGVLSAQNMLTGSFRGAMLTDDVPSPGIQPARHAIIGSTSVRHLLSAGVGLDTEIAFEGGSAGTGRVALVDIAPEPEEEEEEVTDLSKLLKADLVAMADTAGLDSTGTKADIISRLSSA